jgi:hypothetical protein
MSGPDKDKVVMKCCSIRLVMFDVSRTIDAEVESTPRADMAETVVSHSGRNEK